MIKTIGFIDYYLDEWHANTYPGLIAEYNEEHGTEYKVAYAYGEMDRDGGLTTSEWCEKYGARPCDSIEELCSLADYVIILAPSDPEKHLGYAKRVFDAKKNAYVDKTFAENYVSACKIFESAKENGVKFFSSSALRYADEIASRHADATFAVTFGGGSNLQEYIIHQIEMVVKCLGVGAETVAVTEKGGVCTAEVSYPDARRAVMNYSPDFNFKIAFDPSAKEDAASPVCSRFFCSLMADIIRFFETGEVSFDVNETLEVIKIRDMVLNARKGI